MAYPVPMDTPPAFLHEVWERTRPAVQAYIRALEARVEALEAMVQALQEHNRALQEQLHQTSRNSSRPPASDPPQSERLHRPRSKRRRGGQPGHPGHTRPLLPVEEVKVGPAKTRYHLDVLTTLPFYRQDPSIAWSFPSGRPRPSDWLSSVDSDCFLPYGWRLTWAQWPYASGAPLDTPRIFPLR